MFVCLFVLDPYPHLSRGVNSRGRTYGEAPLPPRPLVTPGPRCSSCSLSPHTYCHASCIRSVPSPVLYRYPTKYLVCPIQVQCSTHARQCVHMKKIETVSRPIDDIFTTPTSPLFPRPASPCSLICLSSSFLWERILYLLSVSENGID